MPQGPALRRPEPASARAEGQTGRAGAEAAAPGLAAKPAPRTAEAVSSTLQRPAQARSQSPARNDAPPATVARPHLHAAAAGPPAPEAVAAAVAALPSKPPAGPPPAALQRPRRPAPADELVALPPRQPPFQGRSPAELQPELAGGAGSRHPRREWSDRAEQGSAPPLLSDWRGKLRGPSSELGQAQEYEPLVRVPGWQRAAARRLILAVAQDAQNARQAAFEAARQAAPRREGTPQPRAQRASWQAEQARQAEQAWQAQQARQAEAARGPLLREAVLALPPPADDIEAFDAPLDQPWAEHRGRQAGLAQPDEGGARPAGPGERRDASQPPAGPTPEQPAGEGPAAVVAAPADGPEEYGAVFQEELAQIMRHFARGDGALPPPQQLQQQAQRDTSNLLAALSPPPPSPSRSGPARVMPAQSTVQLLKHIYVESDQETTLTVLRAMDACGRRYATRSHRLLLGLAWFFASCREADGALALLDYARARGVMLRLQLIESAADACAKAGRPRDVRRMLQVMTDEGHPLGAQALSTLLMAHEKAGDLDSVLEVYALMVRLGVPRSAFTYRALADAMVRAGKLEDAVETLDWAEEDGVALSKHVVSGLMAACAKERMLGSLHSVLERCARCGVVLDDVQLARVMGSVLKHNSADDAYEALKALRELGLIASLQEQVGGEHGADGTSPASRDWQHDEAGQSGSPAGGSSGGEEEDGERGAIGDFLAQQAQQEQEGRPRRSAAGDGDEESEEESGDEGDTKGKKHGKDRKKGATAGSGSGASARKQQPAGGRQRHERSLAPWHGPRPRTWPGWGVAGVHSRVVAALFRARQPDKAWELYCSMIGDGLQPDVPTYGRLIAAAGVAGRTGQALEVYSQMKSSGMVPDPFVYLHLIMCLSEDGRAKDWDKILELLHDMHVLLPDFKETHIQNVAISLATRTADTHSAMRVYHLMLQDGVEPQWQTFDTLMMVCERAGDTRGVYAAYRTMRELGIQAYSGTYVALLWTCSTNCHRQRAEAIWSDLKAEGFPPDVAMYSTMIACLERSGDPTRALALFDELQALDADSPQVVHDPSWLELCDAMSAHNADAGAINTALQLSKYMESKGYDLATLRYSRVASLGTSPWHRWRRALSLFDSMRSVLPLPRTRPNLNAWRSAMLACARLRDWQRALRMLAEMQERGVQPDDFVYNVVLSACEAGGALRIALRVARKMRTAGVAYTEHTYSALISSCATAEEGVRLRLAVLMYRRMLRDPGAPANTVLLNSLMSVCAAGGASDAALAVLAGAVQGTLRARPDAITYHAAAEALGRGERWLDGLLVLRACARATTESATWTWDWPIGTSFADPRASTLDLHNLSVAGARIMLRAWLAFLRQAAARGQRLVLTQSVRIVTGRGRNSRTGVPVLRPEVLRALGEDFGIPLVLGPRAHDNPGAVAVEIDRLYAWLLQPGLDLGLGPGEERQVYETVMTGPGDSDGQLAQLLVAAAERQQAAGLAAFFPRRLDHPTGQSMAMLMAIDSGLAEQEGELQSSLVREGCPGDSDDDDDDVALEVDEQDEEEIQTGDSSEE